MDPFALSSYQYELPQELIATRPASPRDSSRLMIVDRKSGNIQLTQFREILQVLQPGNQLVFNDTKVIPARLFGQRETGGKVELLLLNHLGNDEWESLVKPAKKLSVGDVIQIGKSFTCKILEKAGLGQVILRFEYTGTFEENLHAFGQIPLPHYMQRTAVAQDLSDYQTIYAAKPGAVAAPTAGLHFTRELLEDLGQKGISQTHLTLHVGPGTFRPVQTEDIRNHAMHSERVMISQEMANRLNEPCSRRVVVGTTSCRALESAANEEGKVSAGDFKTDIFIYPGYRFKYVDTLLTNFHLPGSSLLMLISAFAGMDLVKEAYQLAIKERFRFYSYGDAMLII